MQTIILLDRLGKELLPLTDNTAVALLPLAGKPLVEYTLEMLAAAGITRAILVTGPFTEQLREHIGAGQRWGLELEYWVGRGEENPATLLRQLPPGDCPERLLLRGDVLTPPWLTAFLKAAAESQATALHGVSGNHLAGISLLREPKAAPALAALGWERLAANPSGNLPKSQPISLEGGPTYWLESLKAYHQANLDAVAGLIHGLNLPGREVAIGLRQGRNTTLSPRSLAVGAALVGSQCRIHPSARFSNTVVIADQVIVDREAQLSNAVILPHSYIGELVTVSDAIVRGNDLIDIDTGGAIKVVDAFLLADLREAALTRSFSTGLNRIAAGLLLLLSLPLWPLAALAAWLENREQPLRTRRLRGNRVERNEFGQTQRREFTAVEWATRIPLLAKLPGLWAVVTGDLRLVGVEAVTREEAAQRQAEWELLADGSPAGLLGPTQLLLPASAPAEERLMSDAFFAGQRDFGKEMAVLKDALLSLLRWRTWWPQQQRSQP